MAVLVLFSPSIHTNHSQISVNYRPNVLISMESLFITITVLFCKSNSRCWQVDVSPELACSGNSWLVERFRLERFHELIIKGLNNHQRIYRSRSHLICELNNSAAHQSLVSKTRKMAGIMTARLIEGRDKRRGH